MLFALFMCTSEQFARERRSIPLTMCSASVWRSQVPGGAVERAARRGPAALRGGGRDRGARGDLPVPAGGRRVAPAGARRLGRAGHAAGRLPPAVPPAHPASRSQLHAAAASALGWTEEQQAFPI